MAPKTKPEIQLNHVYRPTWAFVPFIVVFILWNLVLFSILAKFSLERIPSILGIFAFIFFSTNWVFFQLPFFDPTSSYSISNGVLKKHSWLPKLTKQIELTEIASVQEKIKIREPNAYVVKSRDEKISIKIPWSYGTEELCEYLRLKYRTTGP